MMNSLKNISSSVVITYLITKNQIMKRIVFLIGLFVFSLSLFAQEVPEYNQAIKKITSIQRIMLEASKEVMDAENNLNLEIVHLQFDLITGNDYKWTYRTLYPGNEYVIYSAGETFMIRDLDMKVMWQHPETGDWTTVHEDQRENYSAMVFAKPQGQPLRYAIGVKVASYQEGFKGGHYYIMVAHPLPKDE